MLGTVESPDGRQLVVADVPGLIEGASEGVGLGHEFLAHLERARLLLHVIDSSEDDAEERWRTIDAELAAYGAGLDERPQVVVLNKIDLRPEPPAFAIEDERIVRVFRVSAATGAGIEELKRALFELVPPEEVVPTAPADEQELVDYLVYRPQPSRRAFRVFRTESGFRVTGRPPAPAELERSSRPRARGRTTRSRSATRCSSGASSLFGGAFDPPHVGHVAVAREAKLQLDVDRLVVLVVERPGHKDVHLPAEARLELARAAFPDDEVRLDPYPRTIDLLRAESFDDPLFVVGADEFCDFPTWKEPDAVLELAQLEQRVARLQVRKSQNWSAPTTKSAASNDSARSRSIVRGNGSTCASSSGNAARASSSRVSIRRAPPCDRGVRQRDRSAARRRTCSRRARPRRGRRAAGRTHRPKSAITSAPLEPRRRRLDLVQPPARAFEDPLPSSSGAEGRPVTRKPRSVRNALRAARGLRPVDEVVDELLLVQGTVGTTSSGGTSSKARVRCPRRSRPTRKVRMMRSSSIANRQLRASGRSCSRDHLLRRGRRRRRRAPRAIVRQRSSAWPSDESSTCRRSRARSRCARNS